MSRLGWVYFFKPRALPGPIKIGWSLDPQARLADIGATSPLPLEMIGCVRGRHADERFLHRCFATQHSHNEWFFVDADLLAAISTVMDAGSVDAVRGVLLPVGSIRTIAQKFRSPEYRRFLSFTNRISWAERRIGARCPRPKDVTSILERIYHVGYEPAADELSRLEQYLLELAQPRKLAA